MAEFVCKLGTGTGRVLHETRQAVSEDELRRHLAGGCTQCAGSLAEAQATWAALPLALDPQTPSPAVKVRLMERVQ